MAGLTLPQRDSSTPCHILSPIRVKVSAWTRKPLVFFRQVCWPVFLLIPMVLPSSSLASDQDGVAFKSIGVQPVLDLKGQSPHAILPAGIRPLFSPEEQEAFLEELEGHPPNWESLHSVDIVEQSERLFRFNRERDENRRVRSPLLKTPIAFIWSGVLRQYDAEFQGFTVAMGPEITSTSWGLIRFKPLSIPNNMVAKLSSSLQEAHNVRPSFQKDLQIGILFMGYLVEEESLIYAFSHDDNDQGMILPVVDITNLRYFLN